ncbi:MAG TPA: cupin domain-containing protein [Candidatus Acidoferrales bacterium]|nr:cupin domain-containing protein [Candidatus Acidoferrales bacterium]
MFFRILEKADGVQTALLELGPGETSAQLDNVHPASLRRVVVLRGTIEAEIGDVRVCMHEGDTAVVRRGAEHRFTGASDTDAVMLHFYAVPKE